MVSRATSPWAIGVSALAVLVIELAALEDQPGPAGAELGGSCVGKLGFEFVVAAEGGVDGSGKVTAWGAATVGLHAVPVESVIPHLSCLVEEAAFRAGDDVFKAGVSLVGAFGEGVQPW